MRDWVTRLDEFIKIAGRDILRNAGKISHEQALKKANIEYEKYKNRIKNQPSEVEKHFIKQIEEASKKIKNKIKKPTTKNN